MSGTLYVMHKLFLVKAELGVVNAIVSTLACANHHNDMMVVAKIEQRFHGRLIKAAHRTAIKTNIRFSAASAVLLVAQFLVSSKV